MPLYRPSELAKLGVTAKKSLSQNFLIDQNIIEKLCADIQKGDIVLEIGPGPGAITEKLLQKGAHVIAIEKDKCLAKRLSDLKDERLEVICADVLDYSLENLPKGCKIVASLPYQITTPILEKFIRHHERIKSITVIVQKEVGKRMTAEKNTPEYGSLRLFIEAYSTAYYRFTVKPASFLPAPKVHSCITYLELHPFPFPFSEKDFFKLTRSAFGKKRKMLRASLKDLYPPSKVEEALASMSLKPTTRPSELSLEEFASLFRALEEKK